MMKLPRKQLSNKTASNDIKSTAKDKMAPIQSQQQTTESKLKKVTTSTSQSKTSTATESKIKTGKRTY